MIVRGLPHWPPEKSEGVKRREALVRIAAPVARLAVGLSLKRQGPPADDASRRALRRFTAAFWCGALRLSALALGPRLRTGETAPAVQQAPCAPVVVPVGRGPEASREPG